MLYCVIKFLQSIPDEPGTNRCSKNRASIFDEAGNTIRIYHECESKIEKSVPRIALWHHEACRVITNGDPEGRIFLSLPYTNSRFFFLLTTVFYLKISFQKSLNTLRCNFT